MCKKTLIDPSSVDSGLCSHASRVPTVEFSCLDTLFHENNVAPLPARGPRLERLVDFASASISLRPPNQSAIPLPTLCLSLREQHPTDP